VVLYRSSSMQRLFLELTKREGRKSLPPFRRKIMNVLREACAFALIAALFVAYAIIG